MDLIKTDSGVKYSLALDPSNITMDASYTGTAQPDNTLDLTAFSIDLSSNTERIRIDTSNIIVDNSLNIAVDGSLNISVDGSLNIDADNIINNGNVECVGTLTCLKDPAQSATFKNTIFGGAFDPTLNVDYSRINSSSSLHINSPYNGHIFLNYYNNGASQTVVQNGNLIVQNGWVGIGTSTPQCRLWIEGPNTTLHYGHIGMLGSDARMAQWLGHFGYSVRASGDIMASHFIALTTIHTYSDKRIKTDISLVNDERALNIINKIENYEYNYIDPARKKPLKTIGFLAQNVKEILPNAVRMTKDCIPNELRIVEPVFYSVIDNSNNIKYKLTIPDMLFDVSNSYTGVCRFYVSNYNETEETRIEAMVEGDKKSFLFDKKWDTVFLYGQEIDDFLTIDKPLISALHNSAIQELDRKVIKIENRLSISSTESPTESLESKIDSLTKQFHDIVAQKDLQIANQERRIAALEKQVMKYNR